MSKFQGYSCQDGKVLLHILNLKPEENHCWLDMLGQLQNRPLWLFKCVLLGDPVVSCLACSSSLGVREVADTRVCSNRSPLPLRHVTCVGWLSVHNSQKPRDGHSVYKKMKTEHMSTHLNKWTHEVSHVHSLHFNPSHFPFSKYSNGEQCLGCQPQQIYRLSVWTSAAEPQQAATYASGFNTTPASCGASALLSEASLALLTQQFRVSTWSCLITSGLILLTCRV